MKRRTRHPVLRPMETGEQNPVQPVILIDHVAVGPPVSVYSTVALRGATWRHRRLWMFGALGVTGMVVACLSYMWVFARSAPSDPDQDADTFTTDFLVKSGTILSCCYEGWAGMAFTTGPAPITVVELGRWMLPGNSKTHTLKIVDARTKRDVPGSTVRLSLASLTPDRFHFARVPKPFTLEPNTRYYLISSEKALENSQDSFYAHDAMITTSGAAMLKKPVYWTANSWLELDIQGASYGPVSFRYLRHAVH